MAKILTTAFPIEVKEDQHEVLERYSDTSNDWIRVTRIDQEWVYGQYKTVEHSMILMKRHIIYIY